MKPSTHILGNTFGKLGLGISLGLMLNTQALADADIGIETDSTAANSPQATANVDFCIVVPEVLIFGIGEAGDDISKICWNCGVDGFGAGSTLNTGNNQSYDSTLPPFTDPAPFASADVASVENGAVDEGGAVASVPVYLFYNGGQDVTITVTTKGKDGTGTQDQLDHQTTTDTIAVTEITPAIKSGDIPIPAALTTGTSSTYTNAGVINAKGEWQYTYAPATIPVAGTYEARATYVASAP